MIYFDYQDDLETFNSLMESIDPVVLLENETPAGEDPKQAKESTADSGEPPAEDTTNAEKAKKKQMKETGSLVSSAMQSALMGKNENSDTIRKLLFQAAYQTSENKPDKFAIPNDKGMTIVNDPKSKDFFKQQNKKIVVNLSALIYQCTTKTYLKHLCAVTDWDAEAGSTTNGFHKAIIKALEKLASIIGSGIYGIDDQPTKESKKEEEPKQQQNGPTEEEPKQNEPTDNQPAPDTPDETDQRELFKKIVQEFKDTQFDLMTAECDKVQERSDDPDEYQAAINDITEHFYNDLMEPYQDTADDNTKEKVHTIVEYNVKKQLNTPPGEGDGENGNPDFDWGPNGNDDIDDDEDPDKPKKPELKTYNDQGVWWDKTKEAWGLNDNPLYNAKPNGKTVGQLWNEYGKKRVEEKNKKAQEQYQKDLKNYWKQKGYKTKPNQKPDEDLPQD